MPDSSVIADVSDTLQTVLTDAFSTLAPGPPVAEVHDLQGSISTTPARMTIFLFEVVEDPTLRNRLPERDVVPPNIELRRPPVPLILHYLLTPWSGDRATDHRLLGRALQTLHDGAILSGPQLQGGLAGTSEAIKLKLAPLTLEEQSTRVARRAAAVSPVVDLRRTCHSHRFRRRDGAPGGTLAYARRGRGRRCMTFTVIPSERNVMYSQIGLRLVDEFTGGPSLHRADACVSIRDSAGNWQPLDTQPILSPSGYLLYPAIGRSANVATAPVVRHRVQLASDFYRPEYLRTVDALEFDIHPYDDSQPPAVLPNLPHTVLLLPSAIYPYAAFVRTVRGRTLDTNSDPIANVVVTQGAAERVLSDERGVFALPLRWAPLSGTLVIDAVDHRTGRMDQITLALPQGLLQGQTFTLT